jgi:hypothetical protein
MHKYINKYLKKNIPRNFTDLAFISSGSSAFFEYCSVVRTETKNCRATTQEIQVARGRYFDAQHAGQDHRSGTRAFWETGE